MRKPLVLSALTLAACSGGIAGQPADTGTSSAITAGQIVAGDSPYYWANLTLDEHLAALAAVGAPAQDPSQFVSASDDLTVRLQTWATRLEQAMRAVTHNTTAPSPQVLVLGTSHTMNAWSSGTYARLGTSIGDPSMALPAGETYYLGGDVGQTTIQPVALALDPFVHPTAWARPQSFTQVWNMNPLGAGSCDLKVSSGAILGTGTCPTLAAQSPDALVAATSPFLTVATDLVASFPDERAMVFTMAHELGHMFRAHTSGLTVRKYNFWYEQGPSKATRPVAAADSAELAAEYQAIERTPLGTDGITAAMLPKTLRILPLAAAFFTEVVQTQASTIPTPGLASCPGYTAWAAQYGSPTALLNLALTTQAAAEPLQSAYLALEPIVTGCGTAVHFAFGRTESNGIDWTYVSQALASTMGTFPLPAAPIDNEVLTAFITRAIPVATQLAADEDAFRAKLNANGIGLYTIEQEADEVGAELMTRLGFTQDDILEAWVSFGLAIDKIAPSPDANIDTGRADTATCAQWMHDGWTTKNADGTTSPVVMTIGDINEPHHGDCYRLYNLWRETNSHHYGTGQEPTPLTPDWSVIQAHAADLVTQAAAAGN